jgi:dTDP-4-amino-4,6-dideoxygalactose transaminase
MPVHLYGRLVEPDDLKTLADRYNAIIVEDAAQAHGAISHGRRAGTLGQVAAFSFYPGKNLGAFGDAGAVVTNDDQIAAKVKALREHGQIAKNVHQFLGDTARLDALQACVLRKKLPLIDGWNQQRISAAEKIYNALEDKIDFVAPAFDGQHVYHLLVILMNDRDRQIEKLKESGVQCGCHYPYAINEMECFKGYAFAEQRFANAEKIARECISLPIFPGITEEEIQGIITGVENVIR